jgi:hypothetical protein
VRVAIPDSRIAVRNSRMRVRKTQNVAGALFLMKLVFRAVP